MPFDYSFDLDDSELYCLEMTEKAFRTQGLALSEPVRLGDMENANLYPICMTLMAASPLTLEKPLTLEQAVYMPGNGRHGMWASPLLETVYAPPDDRTTGDLPRHDSRLSLWGDAANDRVRLVKTNSGRAAARDCHRIPGAASPSTGSQRRGRPRISPTPPRGCTQWTQRRAGQRVQQTPILRAQRAGHRHGCRKRRTPLAMTDRIGGGSRPKPRSPSVPIVAVLAVLSSSEPRSRHKLASHLFDSRDKAGERG